jgi:hypothetical protein
MRQPVKQNHHMNTAGGDDLALKDVRDLIQLGKLLRTVLTQDELRELVTGDGGDVAERAPTGTGFATTHRPRHLPTLRPS